MLVAFLALVIALDGPAYAVHAVRSVAAKTKKRDARTILKAHTVTASLLERGLPGTILKGDTLTGTQIAEV